MQDRDVTNDDLRLVNALQVRPRASWSALARAIGSDPVTLARRWERLQSRGIAWIAVYPGGRGAMALVEVECAPADTLTITEHLTRDPEVLTIDLTTGNRDILVTLLAGREQLADYVLHRMSAVPLIRTLRTQIATSVISDARRWRLRALDAAEVAAIEAEPERPARAKVSRDTETALLTILTRDPRITVSALAAELSMSKTRAGAALASVLAMERIVLRTEIARPYSEWPVYAWYFLAVEPRERASTVARLSTLREARLAASMIGSYDLALAVWLRSLDDVSKLETYLADHFPQARVVDRSVVLRTPYHLKRRIDLRGRSLVTRAVPQTVADGRDVNAMGSRTTQIFTRPPGVGRGRLRSATRSTPERAGTPPSPRDRA